MFILKPRISVGHTFTDECERAYTYYQISLYFRDNKKDGSNILDIGVSATK